MSTPIINKEAINEVVIPMIEEIIELLNSNKSKTAIKLEVNDLLETIKKTSQRMEANTYTDPSSHDASHSSKTSHIHIVV